MDYYISTQSMVKWSESKTFMKFQQVIPTLEFIKIISKKLWLLEIYIGIDAES